MKRLFYVYDQNGMANRLFPFAHLIAFGMEHGVQIVNPVFDQYANYFIGTANETRRDYWANAAARDGRIIPPQLNAWAWKYRARCVRRFMPKRWVAPAPSECVTLSELTQRNLSEIWLSGLYAIDNTSFNRHSELIKRCFSPVESVRRRVEKTIQKGREKGDCLVGVHIRQGDYRTFANGMMYFDTTEYVDLMRQAKGLWSNKKITFVICSDTDQPSDAFADSNWVAGPGDEAGDLFTLAECDYLIAPQSTFSQWASWYGNVPRYVHNRKFEAAYGVKPKGLMMSEFRVHQSGFGKFA